MFRGQVCVATQNAPHFNRHVCRFSARARRLRGSHGNLVSLLRALHIDDPVSGEKLLRFRKYAVGDRFSVFSRADELGLVGPSKALGRDKLAGVLKLFAERAHERDVALQVLL
jgi:hypothetical protein